MSNKHDNAIALRRMQSRIEKGERLSDDEVQILSGLRRKENVFKRRVGISKLELREGEEVMDFAWTMMSAVQTNRIILADGSLDAWLTGIFNDHVIVEDGNTGKLFRAEFSRNDEGEISFSTPVEVRQVFVPVDTPSDDGGEAVSAAVSKSATPAFDEIIEIAKSDGRKWGFLPRASTRR